jgi:hypothetical protein
VGLCHDYLDAILAFLSLGWPNDSLGRLGVWNRRLADSGSLGDKDAVKARCSVTVNNGIGYSWLEIWIMLIIKGFKFEISNWLPWSRDYTSDEVVGQSTSIRFGMI